MMDGEKYRQLMDVSCGIAEDLGKRGVSPAMSISATGIALVLGIETFFVGAKQPEQMTADEKARCLAAFEVTAELARERWGAGS